MLMANYLQRSLFKWIGVTFIMLIIAAVIAVFSCSINHWVPKFALSFCASMAQQSHTQILFRTAHYRFPCYLILKDVKILELDGKKPMLESSRMVMRFSFPFLSSATTFKTIVIDNMAVNFPAL